MKTILITGAGQRLGKTIAETFATQGYNLILHYHKSKKETEALAKNLKAKTIQADLQKENSVEKMFQKIGPVDIVINTIGGFIYKPITKTSAKEFEACISNNLFIAYRIAHAVLPLFQKQKFGRLINFGSVGCDQITARPLTTPYYIAKTGLFMLTKTLAQELQNTNITVNMVTPGVLPSGVKPGKNVPLIPFDDVAKAVLFLASEEMNSFNGANLEVSGGWRPE